MEAVNAERIAGFPSGRLFLDSIEQAIAAALLDVCAGRSHSVRPLRGGLGPARLRTITELVRANMEVELTLLDMAQSVELSLAHFSRMFRKSTGVEWWSRDPSERRPNTNPRPDPISLLQ
jgi:AraC family transcriptional regulator